MRLGGSFIVADSFKQSLAEAGIASIDDVFGFTGGRSLTKSNIASWRQRMQLQTTDGHEFFLKRYNCAGALAQLKNWFAHGRVGSFAAFDIVPAGELKKAGIMTPTVAAFGEQWAVLFEKRSFSITEKIPHGEALEKRLPKCFSDASPNGLRDKREFLRRLGRWIARFHATGSRHRDLYLSHIFLTDSGELYLIDLQRTFKPRLLSERYRLKDLTQLFYSMPQDCFSRTDRLRTYLAYCGTEHLSLEDKLKIRGILKKAASMAAHDAKHGRTAPYKSGACSRAV